MRSRTMIGVILLSLGFQGLPLANKLWAADNLASPRELTLGEVLRQAEKTSPQIKAGMAEEKRAQAASGILSSYDYPSLDVAAVDSFGFAGSSAPTPYGFGGLVNSPYREGAGADLLARWTLLDISHWHDLDAAQYKIRSSQEQIRVERMRLDQEALKLFLRASLFRGQRDVWQGIADKTSEILKISKDYVQTGQYNESQLLLIQDQVDEAATKRDSMDESYHQTLKRLALLMGVDPAGMECPLPSSLNEKDLQVIREGSSSPLLNYVKAEEDSSRATIAKYSTERLPKLYTMGSVGVMDGVRLVPQNNYSLWVGVSVPLFEGFRISSEENQAKADTEEKENQTKAVQLEVQDSNDRYDEIIQVSRLQLGQLEGQHSSTLRAFQTAKKRYLAFLSPVSDLREAIRDLARVETQMNDAKVDLLEALGSKVLLNGGSVPE